MFTDGTVDNDDGNPLVDDLFYYARNHDVWNAHVDADAHYDAFGWHEGRDPSAFFSTVDLPLGQSGREGRRRQSARATSTRSAGRKAACLRSTFDPAQYLAANPDVAAAQVDPLAHFLQFGASEGRQPFAPSELIAAQRLRLCLLPAAQSRRRGRACRSVPALPDRRLEGGPRSERAVRHRRLSRDLRRRRGRGRQSARPLSPVRLAGGARSVGRFRHDRISRGQPGRRGRAASIRSRTSSQFGIHEGRSPQADGVWG